MAPEDDPRQFSLFSHLDDARARRLHGHFSWHEFRRGKVLFQAGDPVRGFYLLGNGCVQVYRLSPHGQEQILAFLRAGDPLGEWALFHTQIYPISALCVTSSRMAYIDRAVMDGLVRSDPELACQLLTVVSGKLQRAMGLIEDLSLRDARGRICHYLCGHLEDGAHPGDSIILPVSQAVVARFLGLTSETFSRMLRQLKQEGVLTPGGRRRLVVHHPDRLREVAGLLLTDRS
ncbi:MAG TPA: Crp/Fnr family transcriptional regulator [Candidatus Xenobia bacterium]|jgi:CRP/FNR family transcriptional regulator